MIIMEGIWLLFPNIIKPTTSYFWILICDFTLILFNCFYITDLTYPLVGVIVIEGIIIYFINIL